MTLEEGVRLIKNIKWKSVDKDNMEFEARVSCFQKEAITKLVNLVEDDCLENQA